MSATDEGYPQRWIAVGAIFTMVQSVLMLSGAAVGLSLWTCFMRVESNPVWQTVRLFYFSNFDCSSQYKVKGNIYELDGHNNAAVRTMIIMSIYTALSIMWLIGSFLLLVSAIKGKHIRPVLGSYLHYSWAISMIFVLILDIIAAILYCVDLFYTNDYETVMKLLNLKSGGHSDLEYKSQAPWIMALLTSKGLILWIIDIAVMIYLHSQFKKLFLIRQQAEFVRAHLATVPAYLWPVELQKNLPSSKDALAPIDHTLSLPRLVNQDGRVVGTTSTSGSTAVRTSALQMAARQGFSYERPPTWSPTNQEIMSPRSTQTTPQKYGYGGYSQDVTDNWLTARESAPPRVNDRSSNVHQRDNDVFY